MAAHFLTSYSNAYRVSNSMYTVYHVIVSQAIGYPVHAQSLTRAAGYYILTGPWTVLKPRANQRSNLNLTDEVFTFSLQFPHLCVKPCKNIYKTKYRFRHMLSIILSALENQDEKDGCGWLLKFKRNYWGIPQIRSVASSCKLQETINLRSMQ